MFYKGLTPSRGPAGSNPSSRTSGRFVHFRAGSPLSMPGPASSTVNPKRPSLQSPCCVYPTQKQRIGLKIYCIAIAIIMCAAVSRAGDGGSSFSKFSPGAFDRGTWAVDAGAGYFASFAFSDSPRPTINYQLNDLRIGWMYDSPRHEGWLRGNNEFLLETIAGPVTQGPLRGYLAGASPLWRYNFVQEGSRWAPYVQLGMGAVWNNEFHSHKQDEIGEGFEFLLQPDVGLKYLISDQWAVSIEAGYRHISNGGLAYSRNEGLNSLGGLMCVSYSFR